MAQPGKVRDNYDIPPTPPCLIVPLATVLLAKAVTERLEDREMRVGDVLDAKHLIPLQRESLGKKRIVLQQPAEGRADT